MPKDELAEVLDGSVALFWPDMHESDVEAEPLRGYLRREGGWAVFEALTEAPMAFDMFDAPPPHSLAGMAPATGLLLLELPSPSSSTNFGGYKASTQTFRARTAVGSVPLDRLKSTRILELQAHFLGITTWAQLEPISYEQTKDSDGRLLTLSIKLGRSEVASVPLHGGRQLSLSSTWDAPGGSDQSTIYAPITISCKVAPRRKAIDIFGLLGPLLHIQNLLNFAHEGFVAASGGGCNLDLAPPSRNPQFEPATRPMWNGALMRALPAVESLTPKQVPAFTLASIGGLHGLRRWIRLAETYPLAANAVTHLYRMGHTRATDAIRDAANGIEYWVGAHSRTAKWPRLPGNTRKGSPAKALARHLGEPFTSWIGDPDRWAEEFWDTYNKLKHEPNFIFENQNLASLATSGRLLLAAALLNRAATSKMPSRQLFRSSSYYNLGLEFRERYK